MIWYEQYEFAGIVRELIDHPTEPTRHGPYEVWTRNATGHPHLHLSSHASYEEAVDIVLTYCDARREDAARFTDDLAAERRIRAVGGASMGGATL